MVFRVEVSGRAGEIVVRAASSEQFQGQVVDAVLEPDQVMIRIHESGDTFRMDDRQTI